MDEYSLTPDLSLLVTLEDEKLVVRANRQRKLRLLASSESEFSFDELKARIAFVRDATGTVTGLVLRRNGREAHGRKRLPDPLGGRRPWAESLAPDPEREG